MCFTKVEAVLHSDGRIDCTVFLAASKRNRIRKAFRIKGIKCPVRFTVYLFKKMEGIMSHMILLRNESKKKILIYEKHFIIAVKKKTK